MPWFDEFLYGVTGDQPGCNVNDFLDEMQGNEYTMHMDGEICGNVESQTTHLNGMEFFYPNKGTTGEEMGPIEEESDSDDESEDNQILTDDSELPLMHDYERESEDDDMKGDCDDGPVMFNKHKLLQTLHWYPI
ncbi:hypothetical protein LIER_03792 [Lithospermum erythrorhizon]|uniref:Uncharacterized protein n=1 Tax=Lithospermum erythrorhizon TaxID=34254 RepID=A0AAV3NYF8_LITER